MNLKAKLLHQTQQYQITLYPLDQIMQLTWIQPPTPKEYECGTMKLVELLHFYHVKKLISDCTKRGDPTPQDLVWLSHQVVPQLCNEEVRQLALVVPQNEHHARHLECCLMTTNACYDLQFFHAPKEAMDWLRHFPTQQYHTMAVA